MYGSYSSAEVKLGKSWQNENMAGIIRITRIIFERNGYNKSVTQTGINISILFWEEQSDIFEFGDEESEPGSNERCRK